jgi:hypothetical protein
VVLLLDPQVDRVPQLQAPESLQQRLIPGILGLCRQANAAARSDAVDPRTLVLNTVSMAQPACTRLITDAGAIGVRRLLVNCWPVRGT